MDGVETYLQVGYYGKIPTQGDFVSKGLDRGVEDIIDTWLRASIRESQRDLGSGWLDAFLVTPIWRIALGAGVAGPDPIVAVMMPSVDRVGRYFPLIIAAPVPFRQARLGQLSAMTGFYEAAEKLALSTLDPDFHIGAFDAAVRELQLPMARMQKMRGTPPAQGQSLWWTLQVPDAVRQETGLPDPERFASLFLSTAAQTAPKPTAKDTSPTETRHVLLQTDCAGTGLKGTKRPVLCEATVISDSHQAMSLVSGIGDAPGLANAINSVASGLAEIGNPFSMSDLVADAKGKLGTANTLLRARGLPSGQTFAASIVTLLIQADRYAVLWAGHARAYLLRDGMFQQLTRDHVEARMPTMLTRAIGASPTLSLDTAIGQVCPEDRFLLCSHGLYSALNEREIAETLHLGSSSAQVVTHLTQDALIAGASLDASALSVMLSRRQQNSAD